MTIPNSATPQDPHSNSASSDAPLPNSALLLTLSLYTLAVLLNYDALVGAVYSLYFGLTPAIPSSAFLCGLTAVTCGLNYLVTSHWQDLWLGRIFVALMGVALFVGYTTYIANVIAHMIMIAFFAPTLLSYYFPSYRMYRREHHQAVTRDWRMQ